jgi:hypothetical protein
MRDAATGRHLWSRTGVLSSAEGNMVLCLWYSTQGMSGGSGSHVTIDDSYLYFVGGVHDKIYAVDRKMGSEQLFLEIEPSEKPAWMQDRNGFT